MNLLHRGTFKMESDETPFPGIPGLIKRTKVLRDFNKKQKVEALLDENVIKNVLWATSIQHQSP